MSSHILTEVDRLATRIGIIHQGRLIEELDAAQVEHLRARRLEVGARNMDIASSALVQAGFDVKGGEGTLLLSEPRAVNAPDDVAAILVQAGAPPTRLVVVQEDLESHFLRLTEPKV
jgi:ABC-2 type transport system ATP-binding protein